MNISVQQWLKDSIKTLSEAGIASARLDSLILLEDELNKNRAHILANPSFEIPSGKLALLNQKIKRRADHEPLAYIRGHSEFYGRSFKVTQHTLEPRPETESIIELLSDQASNVQSIVDIGTGSGCIAITSALLFTDIPVYGTDISPECLKVAQHNNRVHKSSVRLELGNLLEPVIEHILDKSFLITANLPYVPANMTINRAAMHEPSLAIFGGHDGLDVYRTMFDQITHHNLNASVVITESLPPQHEEMKNLAQRHNYQLTKSNGFAQLFIND